MREPLVVMIVDHKTFGRAIAARLVHLLPPASVVVGIDTEYNNLDRLKSLTDSLYILKPPSPDIYPSVDVPRLEQLARTHKDDHGERTNKRLKVQPFYQRDRNGKPKKW